MVNPFLDRRVAFVGKLGGLTRREAGALVRRLGGTVPRDEQQADLLVVGVDAAESHVNRTDIETIPETELWQQLGVLPNDSGARQLFTPAMLAKLLGVPVAAIRRWHKAGLIHPQHTVHRLSYFTFAEIVIAKRLVELVENGASPAAIESQFNELTRQWPNVPRPLAQLALVVEGRHLLVKHGGATLEPSGQQRFLFETPDSDQGDDLLPLPSTLSSAPHTPQQLIALAEDRDEAGDVPAACDLYRAALAAGGPQPQVCFQLAECLYRLGDLSAARERYAMAIELDEQFVEARLNLGCVLAEMEQHELAIAALQGALTLHADYADAHYHLARLLESEQPSAAAEHRARYEALMPDSPWLAGPE